MELLDTALALNDAGCSVVPVSTDGTKTPAVAWKAYQTDPAVPDQLRRWFTNGHYEGLGVICGTVSAGLEMLEVEGRSPELVASLATLMTDNGFGDLWTRLCTGYLEQSPSGGMHWLYRVDGPPRGNTKLARRPRADGNGVDVLIETRGEGGYTVVAPSAGRTHTTGRAWTVLAGGPQTIPLLTVDERDALHAIATMLDQMPVADPTEHTHTPDLLTPTGGTRPGDDYNTRATWDDILGIRGWRRTKTFGTRGYGWTRPDKSPRDGISATTGTSSDGADRLYVFSTSTEFDTERPYSKFSAYAHLEHAGDHTAAARALRRAGYGAPPPEPTRTIDHGDSEPPEDTPTQVDEPVSYSRTDDGNALRLVDAHHDTIRYCPQRGTWLRWETHRWVWDDAGHVTEYARRVARDLPTDEKVDAAHRRTSLSARGISAMVRLAQTDRRIVAAQADLDARPFELNTPAGIVNLRTGKLHDPDPAALHTRSTSVAPDNGPAPRWQRFLADTFAGDPGLTTYVQRLLGQSLIGVVLEQLLPFAYGAGANGKTTLLSVVQRIAGIGEAGYSISSPADLLIASSNQGHPTEIARLSGARLVVTSELEDSQRFAEAKVKQLTGGDVISGRFMRQDWFSFAPTHTLWLLANHQPEVRAGGPAFWRRIALLPFLHTVPPDQRDPHLEDHLVEDEAPQILAWLVTGAADYLTHGLAAPDSVTTATSDYERDQDTVARFVEDRCQIAPPGTQGYAARSSEVRSAYETWCRQEGETPIAPKTFTLALRSRFDVMSVRSRNARILDGIRLVNDDDASPENGDASHNDPDDTQLEWWKR